MLTSNQLLQETINKIVSQNSTWVVIRTSALEKLGDALLIADEIATPHSVAAKTKREIAHVHMAGKVQDYSMHAVLSPADCKEVIGKGWGERMTLAGTLMPSEYLMIYTPRTKEEVDVVGKIVEAAVGFMSGSGGEGN